MKLNNVNDKQKAAGVSVQKRVKPGKNNVGEGRATVSRITINLITGIVLITVTVSAVLFWMARSQNAQAAEATKTMVLGGVSSLEGLVQGFVNDYSWWQAGYDAYVDDDQEWIEDNFGSAIVDTQITDMILIVSADAQIDYARGLQGNPTPVREVFTQDVLDDVVALTADMPHTNDAARPWYVLDGNNIVLIAVNRITPVSVLDEEEVDPSILPLLVQGIYLNEERLTELGQQFLIDDIRLHVGEPTSEILARGLPLINDMDGNTIGALVWTPPTPGYEVLQSVIVPMGIVLGLFTIVAFATVFRARRLAVVLAKTNEDLEVSEKGLAEQLITVAGEKEKIESIVSSIGEGLIAADSEGKIFLCNSVGAILIGKKRNEILGKTILEVFRIASKSKNGKNVNASPEFDSVLGILQTKKTVEVPEVSFTRSDGQIMILSITATPIESNGAYIGGIFIFSDVTEQKMVEDAKKRFISTAAHQLRTPLTGVKWSMSELVESKSKSSPKAKKALLVKSYESINRIVSLVNDLLNVDKIESRQIEFSFASTSIATLIRNTLSELMAQMEKKGLKVEFKLKRNIPRLNVDKTNMQVVFQNLLENALRYTPAKGSISISMSVEDEDVRVSIADTGIGIPHGEQKSIFLRFFRASNAVAVEPNGSGLGLYICKEIIKQHNGKIWFESEEGKGSTFHVVLPVGNKKT